MKHESPVGKRRSMLVETRRRENKSELGFHSTKYTTNTSAGARKRIETSPTQNDYASTDN